MATVFEKRGSNRTRRIQPVDPRDGAMVTPEQAERRARNLAEAKAAFERWMAGERPDYEEDEMTDDYFAFQASRFKDNWNDLWSGGFGSFEDITKIPCMRFTDKKPCQFASISTTLQIFALKVAGISGGLQWPLHVFGKVAIRDSVDHNRNMVFDRTRDNCQIVTREGPYLKLTGPTRAVVLVDPVTFEVDLKVKGATEDEHLSFLAVSYRRSHTSLDSVMRKTDYTSKLSTVEFALGVILNSVEATISVRVTRGSWPDGSRAQFAAYTASISREVILLDSEDNKVPVAGDGSILLSRRVVSVEVIGQLKVSVKAWQGNDKVIRRKCFKPQEAGRSIGTLDLGFCEMDVTIAWSLF